MGVFLTAVGAALILAGLLDMFHTLLHPSGTGRISRRVLFVAWRISKAAGHRFGSVVGPAGMVTVVLVWVALQGLGWALVYLPHIPGGFTYSPGVEPSSYPDFFEALYVSLVTLSTLGFGDAVPTDAWIRMAAPLEALTGFALVTAALTWFTQVYPPLVRRRSLALKLKGLAQSRYAEKIAILDAAAAAATLSGLSADIAGVQVDFIQNTEGFYFREEDPGLSLARQLEYALHLRDTALAAPDPGVQAGGQQLSFALDELAAALKNNIFNDVTGTKEVFAAYASEHGQDQGNDSH